MKTENSTPSRLFVRFGLYAGFRLLCVRLAVHVHSLSLLGWGAPACCRTTLKSEIRNRKEAENQNPESPNQRARANLWARLDHVVVVSSLKLLSSVVSIFLYNLVR